MIKKIEGTHQPVVTDLADTCSTSLAYLLMILCPATLETWSEINHREVTCSPYSIPHSNCGVRHTANLYTWQLKGKSLQWINQYFSGSSKRLGKYWIKFWERWFAELMRNGDFAWYLPLSKKSEKIYEDTSLINLRSLLYKRLGRLKVSDRNSTGVISLPPLI